MLIVFSGAPGVDKTTLSRGLAQQLGAIHLRINTIEQPIMAVYGDDIADVGYRVAYGVARDNLKLGHAVIADCVNDVNIARDAWREVALGIEVPVVEIQVICSDVVEHRRRVEIRLSDIPGFTPPSWRKICPHGERFAIGGRSHGIVNVS